MRVTVVRAEVLPFSLSLAGGVRSAAGSWSRREGLLLRVFDREGAWGQGEASPLPGYSADSLATCREQLALLGQRLPMEIEDEAGDRPGGMEGVLRRALSGLSLSAAAARFAVETAALDLLGRSRGVGLAALLGPVRERTLRVSALLNGEAEDEVLEQAAAALARGIGTVKLKLGRTAGGFSADLALLRALRRRFGDEVEVRLDANGSFPEAEAEARLAALLPWRPELVEEPVPAEAMLGWQRLPPVPLALDESLQRSEERADVLLRKKTCRALVLKPMALGGFLRCLELARLAERHGAGVIVTHLFDGPVALAAAAELALALPGSVIPCGLDRHPGLGGAAATGVPQVRGGTIVHSGLPGLGMGPWVPPGEAEA